MLEGEVRVVMAEFHQAQVVLVVEAEVVEAQELRQTAQQIQAAVEEVMVMVCHLVQVTAVLVLLLLLTKKHYKL
jgi:hypothetical protein